MGVVADSNLRLRTSQAPPRTHAGRNHGLQGRRPHPGRLRPHRDQPRRARDARPDGDARALRRLQAARRRPDRRLAAHDDPDRRPDRDAGRARRRGALGLLQHLLHPGPRGRRRRGRPERHRRRPAGRPGLRLEGRDAGGVLVVHPADPACWPGRQVRQHDPRRRRRRHPARPPRRRGREDRRRARPGHRHEPRAEGHLRRAQRLASPRAPTAGPRSPARSRASPRRPPPASTASTT